MVFRTESPHRSMQRQRSKGKNAILRLAAILGIAAAHFTAGFIALLIAFGGSMSRFDSPSPGPLSLSERIVGVLTTVLHFP